MQGREAEAFVENVELFGRGRGEKRLLIRLDVADWSGRVSVLSKRSERRRAAGVGRLPCRSLELLRKGRDLLLL